MKSQNESSKRNFIQICWDFEKHDDPKTTSSWIALLILIIGIIVYSAIYLSFNSLPDGILVKDESNHPGSFIGERAYDTLRFLTAVGPKVGGSTENEIFAAGLIYSIIQSIRLEADSSKQLDVNVEFFESAFNIGSRSNAYKGLQNIIVRLRPSDEPVPEYSLLINSHFDTVHTSPGAGDAGSMISVMLEILRVLSKSTETFKHSIIFLFNGSEETNLAGSHAFITQHIWAGSVRALINLDAAGTGGREIMFQAGPNHPWLMNYYRKSAPRPFASAMGEELFQNGFIPSDTDFRIFRDYGSVRGLDFAYSTNGYVYHTKHDALKVVSYGTLQHTGDNILAVTKALANAHEMDNLSEHADGKVVFYDYLGWFMVYYTEQQGIILNFIVAGIALFTICLSISTMMTKDIKYTSILIEFGLILIVQALSIVIGAGLAYLLGLFYDAIGQSMSWFSQTWLIFGMYFCPIMFGLAFGPAMYITFWKSHEKNIDVSLKTQMFLNAHSFFLSALLIALTILKIRSAFIVMVAVFFYTISTLINFIFATLTNYNVLKKVKFQYWVAIHFLGQIMPYMFYSYYAVVIFSTFIPLSARNGPDSNPEEIISFVSILITLLLTGFIVPFVLMFKSPKIITSGFLVLFLISFILIWTPVGFPYREEVASQRYYVNHIRREHISADGTQTLFSPIMAAGILDRHSVKTLKENVYRMSESKNLDEFCELDLNCNFGLYQYIGGNLILDNVSEPYLENVTIEEVAERVYFNNSIQYSLELTGLSHMRIYISPAVGVRLRGFNIGTTLYGVQHDGRDVYQINYFQGTNHRPVNLILTMEMPDSQHSGTIFDIAVAAQYMKYSITSDYNLFINSFPKYAHVAPIVTSYVSRTF